MGRRAKQAALEVLVSFEPARIAAECLARAYELVLPIHRRQTRSDRHEDATRRAVAVVGVDSGPLHFAAALEKPGVAIFGPTDPIQTGPYGETMAVVRAPGWETTYRRDGATHPSMEAVTPEEVFSTLMRVLERQAHGAGPRV